MALELWRAETLNDYRIQPGDRHAIQALATCDFSFSVDVELAKPYEELHIVPLANPHHKHYGFDANELGSYIDNPEAALFTLQYKGLPIGFLAVSRSWNGYATIEDFAIDTRHRGKGLARQLMDAAAHWASGLGMFGLRLETQSNNVAACVFYKRYGFVLGGYDGLLYSATPTLAGEVALFWYLPFAKSAPEA